MKYHIAYEYKLHGTIEVEATSLDEAKELAAELSVNNPDEHYVDDSFEIDEDETRWLNNRPNIANIVC
jgi:hypothetical protein